MSELKPCPFCGKQPDYDVRQAKNSSTGEWHSVDCSNPNCLDVITMCSTKAEAIRAWNIRAPGWISVEDRLPEKGQYVVVLADRYWNVPDGIDEMKVTATGYLAEFGGHVYWSIFGERAMELSSFTHWMPLPPEPTSIT